MLKSEKNVACVELRRTLFEASDLLQVEKKLASGAKFQNQVKFLYRLKSMNHFYNKRVINFL